MMSNAFIVGRDQIRLKNTNNLVSSSHSYSDVGKKIEIVHSTLLSIFQFQTVYFGSFYVHSPPPLVLPSHSPMRVPPPCPGESPAVSVLRLNDIRTLRRQTNQQ